MMHREAASWYSTPGVVRAVVGLVLVPLLFGTGCARGGEAPSTSAPAVSPQGAAPAPVAAAPAAPAAGGPLSPPVPVRVAIGEIVPEVGWYVAHERGYF